MTRRPVVGLRDHLPQRWRDQRGVEVPPEVVTTAFADALDALAAAGAADPVAGGGVLEVPAGRWRVTTSERSPHAGVLIEAPGTTVRGAGVRATRIELATPASAHTVSVRARRSPGGRRGAPPHDVTIERCTIVGNRAVHVPKAGGHGISVRDGAAHLHLRDVVVEDAAANALGLERTGEHRGVFDGLSLRNVALLRSGRSAIDIKNYDVGAPQRSGGRSWIRGLTVDGVALAWDEDDPQGAQHALHLRGQRHLVNVDLRARRGIWFLNSAGGPVNGRGAQHSTLDNFVVDVSGPVAIAARAADVTARSAHWRVVTDPRDQHDPRVLPVAGVRYWTWPDGPPRVLRADRFTRSGGRLPTGWVRRTGDVSCGGDGLVVGTVAGGAEAAAVVDLGDGDVDLRWRGLTATAPSYAVVLRDDGVGRRLEVVVEPQQGRLALVDRWPAGARLVAEAVPGLGRAPLDLWIRTSGDQVEVGLGAGPPVLAAQVGREACGTRVGLAVDHGGAVAARSLWAWSAPPPRWAGSVRRVPSVEPPDLVRPSRGAVPVERFVGRFEDLAGVLDGPATKDVVAFELDERGLTTVEFEVHGRSVPWLPGSPDDVVWLAASGGPAVRRARRQVRDDHVELSGITPVQVVQRRVAPGPGERTEQARFPTHVAVRVAGDRAEGSVVVDEVPGTFAGLRLAFTARRRPPEAR